MRSTHSSAATTAAVPPLPKGQSTLLQYFTPQRSPMAKAHDYSPATTSGSQAGGLSGGRWSDDTGIGPVASEEAKSSTGTRLSLSPSCSPVLRVTAPFLEAIAAPVNWRAVGGHVLSEGSAALMSGASSDDGESADHAGDPRSAESEDGEVSNDVLIGAMLGLETVAECETAPHVVAVTTRSSSSQSRSTSIRSFHFADEDADEQGPLLARLAKAFARSSDDDDESGVMNAPVAPRALPVNRLTPTAKDDPAPSRQTAPSAVVQRRAGPKMTQTFLDFGQSSLSVGTTCPRCGMLYAGVEEDRAVHRRTCAALATHRLATTHGMSEAAVRATVRLTASLEEDGVRRGSWSPQGQLSVGGGRGAGARKRTRTGMLTATESDNTDSVTSSTRHPVRLLHTDVAVDLLEMLTSSSSSTKKKTARASTRANDGKRKRGTPPSHTDLCQRGEASPRFRSLVAYVVDCSNPDAASSAPVLRLIEALGFLDLVEPVRAYRLALVVDTQTRRVVVVLAGRASLREQDPELLLVPRADGTRVCCTQAHFSLCDVDFIWQASTSGLADAVLAHTHAGEAETLAAVKSADPLQRLLHPKEARQREKSAALAHAQHVRKQALALALSTLCQHIIYGQSLHAVEQCSYSGQLFSRSDDEPATQHLSRPDLCDALNLLLDGADRTDAITPSDLFEHRGDGEESDESGCDSIAVGTSDVEKGPCGELSAASAWSSVAGHEALQRQRSLY